MGRPYYSSSSPRLAAGQKSRIILVLSLYAIDSFLSSVSAFSINSGRRPSGLAVTLFRRLILLGEFHRRGSRLIIFLFFHGSPHHCIGFHTTVSMELVCAYQGSNIRQAYCMASFTSKDVFSSTSRRISSRPRSMANPKPLAVVILPSVTTPSFTRSAPISLSSKPG